MRREEFEAKVRRRNGAKKMAMPISTLLVIHLVHCFPLLLLLLRYPDSPVRRDCATQALEEVAVSTPRDLVRLGAFPDALVEAVKDRIGAERFAPLARVITTEAVIHWRKRGDKLLEQRPWLELWVHQG